MPTKVEPRSRISCEVAEGVGGGLEEWTKASRVPLGDDDMVSTRLGVRLLLLGCEIGWVGGGSGEEAHSDRVLGGWDKLGVLYV